MLYRVVAQLYRVSDLSDPAPDDSSMSDTSSISSISSSSTTPPGARDILVFGDAVRLRWASSAGGLSDGKGWGAATAGSGSGSGSRGRVADGTVTLMWEGSLLCLFVCVCVRGCSHHLFIRGMMDDLRGLIEI